MAYQMWPANAIHISQCLHSFGTVPDLCHPLHVTICVKIGPTLDILVKLLLNKTLYSNPLHVACILVQCANSASGQ